MYRGCEIAKVSAYAHRARPSNFVIATVTDADVLAYGKPAWEAALEWANGIRRNVNGWNCAKDATNEAQALADLGALR